MATQSPAPTLCVLRVTTCAVCRGTGYVTPRAGAAVPQVACQECAGTGGLAERLPLATALQSDPATRAALRAVLAEVCGEMAASGLAPGVWLAAAARALEEEQD